MNQTTFDRDASKLFRVLLFAVFAVFFTLLFAPQLAQSQETGVRVVLLDVPYGGTELAMEELSKIEGLDVRESAWFYNQVKGRGFHTEGIESKPKDLRWVMSGSSIVWIIEFVLI